MAMKHPKYYHIKFTRHALLKMYNQKAVQFGMTQAMGLVLLSISKEGMLSTSIVPSLGMEATSMSRIMNSLEVNNLIYREKYKKDKRMVRAFLTSEGVIKGKLQKKWWEGLII